MGWEDQEYPHNNTRITIMKYLKKKKRLLKTILSPVTQLRNLRQHYLQINAEIVNGTCPHCKHDTVLVSIWTNSLYRCMTCGFDVKQLVNGKISYIPHVTDPKNFDTT